MIRFARIKPTPSIIVKTIDFFIIGVINVTNRLRKRSIGCTFDIEIHINCISAASFCCVIESRICTVCRINMSSWAVSLVHLLCVCIFCKIQPNARKKAFPSMEITRQTFRLYFKLYYYLII